jgi:predicted small integral membrane protein
MNLSQKIICFLFFVISISTPAFGADSYLIEEWTFDSSSPETGVNGLRINTWEAVSPNSVPTPGILRYQTEGWSSLANFEDIEASVISELRLTVTVDDMLMGSDGIEHDRVRFQIQTSAGPLRLHLTTDGTGMLIADMEQGTRETNEFVVPLLDQDNYAGATKMPLTLIATWNFEENTMSLEATGSVVIPKTTQTAENLDNISDIRFLRMNGISFSNGGFMDLDTVTIDFLEFTPPDPASQNTVERWNFTGSNPESGVNAGSIDVWSDASPNSQPTPGVLRYATSGDSNKLAFTDLNTSDIEQLRLQIKLDDIRIGTNGAGKDRVIFRFQTDAGLLELELNVYTNNQLTIDMEQGTGNTGDLDVDLLDQDDYSGLDIPLVLTSIWDFSTNTMYFEASGAIHASGSIAADNLAQVNTIQSFQVSGGGMQYGTYLDLLSVDIAATGLLVETGFESESLGLGTSGNAPVTIAYEDARAGDRVMMAQLTPDSANKFRTEVTLSSRFNIDVDTNYWIGVSIKQGDDYHGTVEYDDQTMLMQLHYYDWHYEVDAIDANGKPVKQQPQPFVLRFNDGVDTVQVECETSTDGLTKVKRSLGDPTPAVFGEWVDWVVHLKLSDTHGLFQVWRNGELVLDWEGDNHSALIKTSASMGPRGMASPMIQPLCSRPLMPQVPVAVGWCASRRGNI